jgi:hypothetical protein
MILILPVDYVTVTNSVYMHSIAARYEEESKRTCRDYESLSELAMSLI